MDAELDGAPLRSWPLVVIPCSKAKLAGIHAAENLYVGSYHRAARAAALRMTVPKRVLILSARYGLIGLEDRIESYELTMGQRGSVTVTTLASQAEGLQGPVVVLAGMAYTRMVLAVWPDAETPLAGSRGIGDHLARLKRLGRD